MRYRLHHIGIVVGDIAAAAPGYVADYGYEAVTDVIHDPTQTAYVQFLRLEGDTTYLELVAPDGAESKLALAVKKGLPLNHVAYAVDDIEGACRALGERGSFVISEPVAAVAFGGRRIAWLLGADRVLVELVEQAADEDLIRDRKRSD